MRPSLMTVVFEKDFDRGEQNDGGEVLQKDAPVWEQPTSRLSWANYVRQHRRPEFERGSRV